MKSETVQYRESHALPLNTFLVFYGYILIILILANIAPASATAYTVFFLLGLMGIPLLFIRAAYTITLQNNILEISVKVFARIVIRRWDTREVESAVPLKINNVESSFKIEKNSESTSYLIKTPGALKLSMANKKSCIISTANPAQLANLLQPSGK